jgi:hypothetical protein
VTKDETRASREEWAPSPAREDRALAREINAAAGASARSLYDFVNGPTPRKAVPVIVSLLPRAQHPAVKEALVRALAVPQARGIGNGAVLRLLRSTKDAHLRFVCANTLSVIATPEDLEQLGKELGVSQDLPTNNMLIRALSRTKDPRALPVLWEMLRTDGTAADAASAIYSIDPSQGVQLLPILERLIEQHSGSWQRAKQVRARITRSRTS